MAVKQVRYENKIFDIHYEIVNNHKDKTIVFLHGWGSNKNVMQTSFSSYLKEYRHIYIDMPGFGKSLNDYVLKTCDYVNIIDEFLLEYKQMLCCIVGHSFGGKIATGLNPPTLVLLSSAGIIERKSLQVRFKIECVKWLKYFGLGHFSIFFRSRDVKNMPQNMYETFKNVVDEKFEDSFQSYTNSALIFWGEQDVSTSLKSGKKIAALIQHSKFYTYAGNHYFFIKYAQDISQRIEDAIL